MNEAQLIRDMIVAVVLALKQTATNLECIKQPCDKVWVGIRRLEQLHDEIEKLIATK